MPRKNTGPRLEQNERGIWEIRWTENRRSNRLSTRTSDLQEAQRALAGFLVEKSRDRNADRVTIATIVKDYLHEHVDSGPVVDKARQHDAAAPLLAHFGDMEPVTITSRDVLEYGRRRRAGQLGKKAVTSNGTIRRELNMLIAAIEHAAKNRRLERTQVPHIPLPQAPAPRDLWLDEREFGIFMDAADQVGGRARLFCYLAGYTAARRRSIEKLTRGQIDLAARLIHYNPPGRVQSKKRRVPVPIGDKLLAVLEPAVRGLKDHELVLGHGGSAYKNFEKVAALAHKWTANNKFLEISPHTLRHTFATLAARRNVSMWEISGVLGDSLSTTTRVYSHHSPDHLRNAVNF